MKGILISQHTERNRREPAGKDKLMLRKITVYCILGAALSAAYGFFVAMAACAEENVVIPEEVKAISEELGQESNICPETIQAICWVESRCQPDAESGGCVGIMQVAPKWHKERMGRLGVTDLTDTRQNMLVAVDYLSDLVQDEEDMEEALMRYHGESRVRERLDAGEMSAYVEGVLALSAELEERNGK